MFFNIIILLNLELITIFMGKTVEDLKKIAAPLQERISNANGELIATLERYYGQCSHDMTPILYALREALQIGIITPETRLVTEITGFLKGIKNPHTYREGIDKDFLKNPREGEFNTHSSGFGGTWTLFDMDSPPQMPLGGSLFGGSAARGLMEISTPKPRLEMYIGDSEVVPVLEKRLEGYQYIRLGKLLGKDLPLSQEMSNKIRQEQTTLVNRVLEIERTQGSKKEYHDLIATAVARGYDKMDVSLQEEGKGVTTTINLGEFVSSRKEE